MKDPGVIHSIEAPRNARFGGPSLKPPVDPSEGFKGDSQSKASKRLHESCPTASLSNWTLKQCTIWWDITRNIKGTTQGMDHKLCHHRNPQGIQSRIPEQSPRASLQGMSYRVCHNRNPPGIQLRIPYQSHYQALP